MLGLFSSQMHSHLRARGFVQRAGKQPVHQAFNALRISVLFEIGVFTHLKGPEDVN